MNYSKVIGYYYNALGLVSCVSTVCSLVLAYWTDRFSLDLSFILWFWLGSNILKASATARIVMAGLMLVFGFPLLLLAPRARAPIPPTGKYRPGHLT